MPTSISRAVQRSERRHLKKFGAAEEDLSGFELMLAVPPCMGGAKLVLDVKERSFPRAAAKN